MFYQRVTETLAEDKKQHPVFFMAFWDLPTKPQNQWSEDQILLQLQPRVIETT
jgi:hypothetical protein